jgi:hypothetical protein
MEHPRGAFKVNYAQVVRAVKKPVSQTTPVAPGSNPNDQNSCKKFSQIAAFA